VSKKGYFSNEMILSPINFEIITIA